MKFIWVFWLFLSGYFLFSGTVTATVPRFNHLDATDQLPSTTVRVVAEDRQGFIWAGTNRGVFRYDGHEIQPGLGPPTLIDPVNNLRINDLYFDTDALLWIASNTQGLLIYDTIAHQIIDHQLPKNPKKINFIQPTDQAGNLWIGTSQGLFLLPANTNQTLNSTAEILSGHNITALLEFPDKVLIGTNAGIYRYNKSSRLLQTEYEDLADSSIQKMLIDEQHRIWIATNNGLFYQPISQPALVLIPETHNRLITDLLRHKNQLWVSSIGAGLFNVDLGSQIVNQYLARRNDKGSIAGDNVLTLYADRQNNLWVGYFNTGLDILPLKNLAYGLETATEGSYNCAPAAEVFAIQVAGDETFIGGTGAVTRYNHHSGQCAVAYLFNDENNRTGIFDIEPMPEGDFLLATGLGLFQYQRHSAKIVEVKLLPSTDPVFFVDHDPQNQGYFVGGTKNLWHLDAGLNEFKSIPFETKQAFYHTTVDHNQNRYFVSHNHLVKLIDNSYLKTLLVEPDGLSSADVDELGNLWIGSNRRGLLKLNPDGNLTFPLEDHHNLNDSTIMSVVVNDGIIWASSKQGLITFEPNTGKIHHHNSALALQDLQFYPNAAFKAGQNVLYFGGRGGYNRLQLDQFEFTEEPPPQASLTGLKRFNRPVWPGQADCELCIDRPIEQLQELALDHRDDIIGFEWSAMAYANPDSVRYAYRLLGLETAWNEVNSSDRNITYTSLRPGDYDFQLMASHDGIKWPDEPLSLAITVSPAPWLSPWALTVYALALVLMTVFIIHRRTRAANLRAVELEHKVEERTLELVDKNAMIEDLLRQKNALFANITHEFKTPLTLILGPINKLKKFLQSTHQQQPVPMTEVQMIDRNTNRLLTMVGHLLKLSAAEDSENQQKVTVQAAVIAAMIVDSFRPLAEQKYSQLLLDTTACPNDVVITLAPESFEIILGNLISNAIKYGGSGAHIKITLRANEETVTLVCEDNGPGIAAADQPLIFERFCRLQQHAHIEGNGIGLSVVKQLIEINGGELGLESEVGRGTRFTLAIPRSHQEVSQTEMDEVINTLTHDVGADQSCSTVLERLDGELIESNEDPETDSRPELLIVEDNQDMQQYILSELTDHFNCHLASNGQLGVEACLKIVPDIVISDVMMPIMDGYEVANFLRQDQRTSHIPIVLLTALNTTQSRIKGWQEHVDSYLTKPFDSEELLIKLHSILAIRQLLQAKNAQRFGNKDKLDLPKLDNEFIKKLREVIANHYTNPNLQRSHLASEMAISERQLLRKTKALINISPIDVLREYRLEQAHQLLQTGKPVNLVSDACGFNSTSYFVRCFKAKYNITPKQYQKQLETQ